MNQSRSYENLSEHEKEMIVKGRVFYICRLCPNSVKVAKSYLAQHIMLRHIDRVYRIVEYIPQSQIEDFQEEKKIDG